MKIIKKLCLLLWIISAAFVLFMCEPVSEVPKEVAIVTEEILNWNISVMPHVFLPSITLSDSEKEVVNHLYEGLTRVINGEVINGMAKHIVIDETALIYTIELKTSKWSDGELIKPEDFIYAWERNEHYYEGVNLLYFETFIKEVSINADQQLVIELFEKNDQLLYQLSHVKFMPVRADVIDFNQPLPVHYAFISNGPYYLSSYEDEQGLVLKRNNYYYDFFGVSINSIEVTVDYNYTRVHNRITNDTLHFSESVDWKKIETHLIYEPTFKIYEDQEYYGYLFNMDRPILNQDKMRALLFEAVEKSSMNPFQTYISNSQVEKDSMFVNGEKINRLVEDLDYEAVKKLDDLEIITRDNPNDIALANHLAESWRTYLGIDCIVNPQNSYDYYMSLKSNNYDVILSRMADVSKYKVEFLNYFLKNKRHIKTNQVKEKESKLLKTYNESKLMFEQIALESPFVFLPLFKNYDTVFISEKIERFSRSDEGLFYFGDSSIEYIKDEPIILEDEKGE